MQCIPSPHPLIESFYGVFFQAIRFDFGLLSISPLRGGQGEFFTAPLMASRQQQDDTSYHCWYWNEDFCNSFLPHFYSFVLLFNCCKYLLSKVISVFFAVPVENCYLCHAKQAWCTKGIRPRFLSLLVLLWVFQELRNLPQKQSLFKHLFYVLPPNGGYVKWFCFSLS